MENSRVNFAFSFLDSINAHSIRRQNDFIKKAHSINHQKFLLKEEKNWRLKECAGEVFQFYRQQGKQRRFNFWRRKIDELLIVERKEKKTRGLEIVWIFL